MAPLIQDESRTLAMSRPAERKEETSKLLDAIIQHKYNLIRISARKEKEISKTGKEEKQKSKKSDLSLVRYYSSLSAGGKQPPPLPSLLVE